MSQATTLEPAGDDRFPSLASLRVAHSALLKRNREEGNEAILAEIEAFIDRGKATGAVLDDESDRWSAQSLLDYWSSILYRNGHEAPDATLVEFDTALAPDLDDDLCPYLGLEAFDEANQHLFFGRQALVNQLLEKLKTNRLLAVVGSSGSGKSSVVLGGLIPQLKAGALPGSDQWCYLSPMVPGSHPLMNLAQLLSLSWEKLADGTNLQVEALSQDPSHLVQLIDEFTEAPVVLVVDQFEEVFTLCSDETERQAFVANLLELIDSPDHGHHVVLTMRTDFESQIVKLSSLKPIFEQSHVRVTALDAGELREAIENPAELVGLKFEDGLIDALLSDVLGEPAALPLLQFTLLKLWDHREHNQVPWQAYQLLGGGRLSLANSADEFYNSLIPEDQITAKRILLRMVRPTEGLEFTSSRIRRRELYQTREANDRIDRVLNRLIEARLVCHAEGEVAKDDQIEVAHEALVRNWPRLVEWLESERITLRQRLELKRRAEQWREHGQDSSRLLRGSLLLEALAYDDLNDVEARFVQHSRQDENRRKSIARMASGLLILLCGSLIFLTTRLIIQQKKLNEAQKQLEIKVEQQSTGLQTLSKTTNFPIINFTLHTGLASAVQGINEGIKNNEIVLSTVENNLRTAIKNFVIVPSLEEKDRADEEFEPVIDYHPFVAYTSDNKYIATTSTLQRNGKSRLIARIWEINEEGQLSQFIRLGEVYSPIIGLSVSRDNEKKGFLIFAATKNGHWHLWHQSGSELNGEQGRKNWQLVTNLVDRDFSTSLDIGGDSKNILVGSRDGRVLCLGLGKGTRSLHNAF